MITVPDCYINSALLIEAECCNREDRVASIARRKKILEISIDEAIMLLENVQIF